MSMKISEYIRELNTMCSEDKKRLPDGPWMHEPNRIEFIYKGLDCVVQRVPYLFHLCGYVAIPKGHKFYNKPYDELNDLEVHGGITFSRGCDIMVCSHGDEEHESQWWLGFDCAHYDDLVPENLLIRSLAYFNEVNAAFNRTYKDIDFVTREIKQLVDQLLSV